MAYTAFISKSAPGNAVHNARKFSEDHPEPDYLLPPALRQRNIHIKTDLTADQVQDEYLTTTRFGQKHGRRHHKAKPIREAVIVCKMDTTENQVRMLMIALEDSLGVRPMYAHVHKDEGHIDEDTGKVKYNPHIHLGYTNLVNGELTHMNQRRMRQAQDICAAVLGMERAKTYKARKEDGEIDKNPKHKDHQTSISRTEAGRGQGGQGRQGRRGRGCNQAHQRRRKPGEDGRDRQSQTVRGKQGAAGEAEGLRDRQAGGLPGFEADQGF